MHAEGASLAFVILSLTSLAIIRYTSNNKAHRLQFVKRIAWVASTHLLYLFEKNTKRNFLVDSGAAVSAFPAGPSDKKSETDSSLSAANGSKIGTYGEILLNLNIGFRREIYLAFYYC